LELYSTYHSISELEFDVSGMLWVFLDLLLFHRCVLFLFCHPLEDVMPPTKSRIDRIDRKGRDTKRKSRQINSD